LSGNLLALGERVALAFSGAACRVARVLGAGGQGEVYEVALEGVDPFANESAAFKCYFANRATKEQWEALSVLVDLGPPSERFLWPTDVAELPDRKTFGYLMPLREPRFSGLSELARRQVTTTFRSLTVAGFQLADSFLALHARGLCYRDISLGNVFFDPRTGDVLICDNDNVAVDGEGHQSVLGTTGFMAPEIERSEAMPSTRTDLYSLAVLLFLLFVNHHPLIGERELSFDCLDQSAYRHLYGTDPRFIFDPADESNRPVQGVHDNAIVLWPLLPEFIKDLFRRAFTDGLRDPLEGRVRESQWKAAVTRLRDSITTCGCGSELFYDDDISTVGGTPPGRCWACGGRPALPPRLKIGRRTVVLNSDTVLYPHHLGGDLYDYGRPLAMVSQHPMDPRVQGLRNLTNETWLAIEHDGTEHRIGEGRSVRLSDGIRIVFPLAEGSIVEDARQPGEGEGGSKW
jgi:DNA-binding helix-hairpin-helix protein with protein kinase domain